jgi:hypothetical protein
MVAKLSVKCTEFEADSRKILQELSKEKDALKSLIEDTERLVDPSTRYTPIEATYQDDKRCFRVPPNSTLETLEERLVELFSIDLFVHKVTIKHHDEHGNLCDIDELEVLLSAYRGSSSSPLCIVVHTHPCLVVVEQVPVEKRSCEDNLPVLCKRAREG